MSASGPDDLHLQHVTMMGLRSTRTLVPDGAVYPHAQELRLTAPTDTSLMASLFPAVPRKQDRFVERNVRMVLSAASVDFSFPRCSEVPDTDFPHAWSRWLFPPPSRLRLRRRLAPVARGCPDTVPPAFLSFSSQPFRHQAHAAAKHLPPLTSRFEEARTDRRSPRPL